LNQSRHAEGGKATPPALTPRSTDVEAAMQRSSEKYVVAGRGAVASDRPFLRSTRGKIIIVVAAIVVIGAIVGGAVGGSVGKKHNNKSPLTATTTTTSSSSGANPTSSSNSSGGVQGSGGNGGGLANVVVPFTPATQGIGANERRR
jgi:hypothetical protein